MFYVLHFTFYALRFTHYVLRITHYTVHHPPQFSRGLLLPYPARHDPVCCRRNPHPPPGRGRDPGRTPPARLLLGELVLELDLVRAALGLAAGAAVPLAAEQALLKRWGHDAVVVPFSHGWGAAEQPEEADALFRLGYWQKESDLFVCALVDGPFSAAVKAWGWRDALIHLTRGHPDLACFMADTVVELSEQLARCAAAGADGIIFGEDLAVRNGPTVRPAHLRQHYFPYLTLLTLAAQDLGLPVIFHSDGNLWPIWQDLFAVRHRRRPGPGPLRGHVAWPRRERAAGRSSVCGAISTWVGWRSLAPPSRSPRICTT